MSTSSIRSLPFAWLAALVVASCSSDPAAAPPTDPAQDAASQDDATQEEASNPTAPDATQEEGSISPIDAAEGGLADSDAGDTETPLAPVLLIDTDMGLDDARVIVSLPMQSKYRLAGVVTVEGTAGAAKGADNALRLLAALGVDSIPVAVGSTKTASGQTIPAPSWRAMAEGLGGLALDPSSRSPETVDGVAFERALLHDAVEPMDVLAIGPVSNLALALTQEPSLSSQIRAVYLLGDFVNCVGYNCTTDPDGAKRLVDSGIPLFMVLEAQTNAVPFDAQLLSEVQSLDGPAAKLVAGFMAAHANGYMKLWDDGVLASMLDPKVVSFSGAGTVQSSTALDSTRLHDVLLGLWDTPAPLMP